MKFRPKEEQILDEILLIGSKWIAFFAIHEIQLAKVRQKMLLLRMKFLRIRLFNKEFGKMATQWAI